MELTDLDTTAVWVPMVAAIVTGMAIGLDREIMAKPAGVRTHTLVCFSAALLMIAASQQAEWVFNPRPGGTIVSDPTRMAHGILTGIGFLCAGVIFRQGSATHGLTTAASLWMTAALGLLYGAGLFWLALAGSVTTLVVLIAFRIIHALLPDRVEVAVHVTARIGDARSGNARSGNAQTGAPGAPTGGITDDAAITRLIAEHAVSMSPPTRQFSAGPEGPVLRLSSNLWLRSDADCARLSHALRDLAGITEVSVAPVPMAHRAPMAPDMS